MIDRSETQDTPDLPPAVTGRQAVRNLRCGSHLGPRSCVAAIPEAGHMTASDPIKSLSKTLARRGPSTYAAGGGAHGAGRERRGGHSGDRRHRGELRDELLNGEVFSTLQEAKVVIEGGRRHHNTLRPPSLLGSVPLAPEVVLWPAALPRPAPPATPAVALRPVMH